MLIGNLSDESDGSDMSDESDWSDESDFEVGVSGAGASRPRGKYDAAGAGRPRPYYSQMKQCGARAPHCYCIVLITIFCDCVSVGLDLLSKDLFLKCYKGSVLV